MDISEWLNRLKNIAEVFSGIKKNDLREFEGRERVLNSTIKACIETRRLTKALKAGASETENNIDGAAVSQLWLDASREMAKFDATVANEFALKAYGWSTGIWGDPNFEKVPRRVEEILAEAMELRESFQPILAKKILR